MSDCTVAVITATKLSLIASRSNNSDSHSNTTKMADLFIQQEQCSPPPPSPSPGAKLVQFSSATLHRAE